MTPTAELRTTAGFCPYLPPGTTSTTPSAEPGAYCGPLVPGVADVVCYIRPLPGNLIPATGMAIGFDRLLVTLGLPPPPAPYAPYVGDGHDGVLHFGHSEHAQDPIVMGPGPTLGFGLTNPYLDPARVIVYPTNVGGEIHSILDRNLVSCAEPAPGPAHVCPNPELPCPVPPPPPPPAGNGTHPTSGAGTTPGTGGGGGNGTMGSNGGNNVTSPNIPAPTQYHGGYSPATFPGRHPEYYTPHGGGALKPICFCGGDGGGPSAGGGTVNIVNGEFTARYTVLKVSSAYGMEWAFNATYRTLSPDATHLDSNGNVDLGFHWDYSYGRHFEVLASDVLRFYDGDGLSAIYLPNLTVGTLIE